MAFVLNSCGDKNNDSRKSAMLLYMAGNNSLGSDLKANINTILSNFVPSDHKELFVFYKGASGSDIIPKLYKVAKKKGAAKAELVTVKVYDINLISSSASTLNMIMNDVSALSDVTIIEDVLLSSHGGSWLPNKGVPAIVRGFGGENADANAIIEIDEMAKVFEQFNLNSILFDACFMGSIEVFYQLRNSAKYILASPAEILAEGINYTFATKYFTQTLSAEALTAIAEATNNMYKGEESDEGKPSFFQSNTLTLTDCSQLEELGKTIKTITKYGNSVAINKDAAPKVTYDGNGMYAGDYKEYLSNLIAKYGNNSEKNQLDEKWSKAFIHYCHTKFLLGKIDLTNSHGVAGYIEKGEINKAVSDYYRQLDWGKLITE